MRYELPYGITVIVDEPFRERSAEPKRPCGSVSSNLAACIAKPDDSPGIGQRRAGQAQALEAFLLALACAGVNIGSEEFVSALDNTVRALADATAHSAIG